MDTEGKLKVREDVYGRDARMIAQLKGSERKVADISVDRPTNNSSKPVRVTPGLYGGPRRAGGGGHFFDWIFDSPPNYVAPRQAQRGGRVTTR